MAYLTGVFPGSVIRGLVASIFFDFFKVFLAMFFSFVWFALGATLLLYANMPPKSMTEPAKGNRRPLSHFVLVPSGTEQGFARRVLNSSAGR